MKIETRLVSELYYVLKQMMEENRGDYSIVIPDQDSTDMFSIEQCKVDEENEHLILFY